MTAHASADPAVAYVVAVDEVFDPLEEARRQWIAHDLDEDLAMAAATSVIHAQQVVTASIERALRPLGLTFARYEILMLLSFSRTGALPMTKVGERLLVHPTGITKLVDKLEAQGLARREPNPRDRRGVLARVTPEGRRLGRRATAVLAGVRFGADLPDGDLRQLVELLRRLRADELVI
jgi:DNA-binding MarR family transcriptional regulator